MQAVKIEEIQNMISKNIDPANFNSWIAPLNFTINNSYLEISASNQFTLDYVKNTFLNTIDNIAKQFNLQTSINTKTKSIANDNKIQTFIPKKQENVNSFDEFITSDENTFVVSACKKLAENKVSFSPLFIYGQSGSGKTLLCNCINNSLTQKTIMMTGNQFLCEFQRALTEKSIFAFKDYCRNCDIFILDGIQEIAGKKATSEEFISLLIDLITNHKNVVITSNYSPSNLDGFDKRAKSIFASGLTADLALPNKDVKKSMFKNSHIDNNLIDILVEKTNNNGHLINGIITKIKTYEDIIGEKITHKNIEKILSDSIEQNKTPLSLIKKMCEKMGTTYDDLCSQRRTKNIVHIRQIIMKVLKDNTKLSLTEIGRLIGNRNHTTVLYSIEKIENTQDLILKAEINELNKICNN